MYIVPVYCQWLWCLCGTNCKTNLAKVCLYLQMYIQIFLVMDEPLVNSKLPSLEIEPVNSVQLSIDLFTVLIVYINFYYDNF